MDDQLLFPTNCGTMQRSQLRVLLFSSVGPLSTLLSILRLYSKYCSLRYGSCTYKIHSFQRVLGLTALQSSIRFLAHVIMGAIVNIATGYLISRVQLRTLVVVSALITMAASPIMAAIDIHGTYWQGAFWGLPLSIVNPDGIVALYLLHIDHHISKAPIR